MAYYRLFILDQHDNLVTGVDLRADMDNEALGWAEYVLQPGRIGEVWCGTRCVGRANPPVREATPADLGQLVRQGVLF